MNQLNTDTDEVNFAVRLAHKAGKTALSMFRKQLKIRLKNDLSPVTMVDQEVERIIREEIKNQFPHHGFLGEEHGSYNLDADDIWIIDPIDGTRSFITGWPIWGTLVAKTQHGKPTIGIIEIPATKEQWVGVSGKGCEYVGNNSIPEITNVSNCRLISESRFYTTSILYFDDSDRVAIEKIMHLSSVPRFGGDCYSYGLLASGHVDLVIEAQLEPYDFMALVPVVEESHGIITDWMGKALNIKSDGRVIAAATPELHAEALAILNN